MSNKLPENRTRYQFEDLIDLQAFSVILKNFAEATGVANGLVLPDGTLLLSFGWQSACKEFHRNHPIANQQCISSNLEIMEQTAEGLIACNECRNGIMDYASRITVDNHTYATLFIGQVFHHAPDLDFFKQQAKIFGFDEKTYLSAIQTIPVIEKHKIRALMDCLVDIAESLVHAGLSQKLRYDAEKSLSLHKEHSIELEDILNASPVGIGWTDQDTGKIEYLNHAFIKMFGYTIVDLPDITTWDKLAYPDPGYRAKVVEPWRKLTQKHYESKTSPPKIELNIRTKSGEIKHVLVSISWAGNKRLANFSDMTDHWLSEQRIYAHDQMLGLIAKGSPLDLILNKIVRQIETEDPSSLCSILLVDNETKNLIIGAAPNLPEAYNQAVNGIAITDKTGSCCTAAFRGERVIVEDVMTHAYWKDYTELASLANIRSCWSEPIISSLGEVLGTFAIYHSSIARPNDNDIERIKFAANLAAIAIENNHTRKELEYRAYYDYLTGLPDRRHFFELAEKELSRAKRYDGMFCLLMLDIDRFKKINDTYGHRTGDKVLQNLAQVTQNSLRELDTIGRIGGEEFAILLPGISKQQGYEAAQRLRRKIEGVEISTSEVDAIKYTVSIGLTIYTKDILTVDTILSQADKALYKAKRTGRNNVCVFDDTL